MSIFFLQFHPHLLRPCHFFLSLQLFLTLIIEHIRRPGQNYVILLKKNKTSVHLLTAQQTYSERMRVPGTKYSLFSLLLVSLRVIENALKQG